ncbi:MAG: M23 family metallopeptidase [Nitrospira sp.]|nr:M23 family metallopeptidase [Nitrospira sp.]
MNHPSDDKWAIMLFRGMTRKPLRISLSRRTFKRVLLAAVLLSVVQVGVLAHYVVQTGQVNDQVAELEGLKEELSQSKGQVVEFSEAVDKMRQRVLTIQSINKKLQVMFGLEPEQGDTAVVSGQGGEEVPYEATLDGRTGILNFDYLTEIGESENPDDPGIMMATDIRNGLSWLDRQTVRQLHVLARLEETAGERVGLWAATPSIWPVKGPVSSKFGPRISPFTGKKAFHAGVDIVAPRGEKVRAPAKGKVVVASYDSRMGHYVRINHRHGIETTYGHLSKILVRYGQEVKRGDLLGRVGSTGRFSTGPHLHYQVAVNDKVVDPLQYILD